MRYGKFSNDGKKYIVTNPDTPRPWFNYLFNDIYHALVSSTGGGFSYYLDPKTNRILRYDHIHTDRPGRYIYIRDEQGNIICPNYQPSRKKLSFFKCEHQPGKTIITSKSKGLKSSITYFVPRNEPLEIWLVSITNQSRKKRRLSVYPFCELISGNVEMESVSRNIACLYNEAYFDKRLKSIVAFKHPSKKKDVPLYSFFTKTGPAGSFETSKERFFGRYRDASEPEAIKKAGFLIPR